MRTLRYRSILVLVRCALSDRARLAAGTMSRRDQMMERPGPRTPRRCVPGTTPAPATCSRRCATKAWSVSRPTRPTRRSRRSTPRRVSTKASISTSRPRSPNVSGSRSSGRRRRGRHHRRDWNGRWDMSVGSMTVTDERAEVLELHPPYYYTPAGLAVQEGSDITSATTTRRQDDRRLRRVHVRLLSCDVTRSNIPGYTFEYSDRGHRSSRVRHRLDGDPGTAGRAGRRGHVGDADLAGGDR